MCPMYDTNMTRVQRIGKPYPRQKGNTKRIWNMRWLGPMYLNIVVSHTNWHSAAKSSVCATSLKLIFDMTISYHTTNYFNVSFS